MLSCRVVHRFWKGCAVPCVAHGGSKQVSSMSFSLAELSTGNLLKGSWDLVSRVIIKVSIFIFTYNPN